MQAVHTKICRVPTLYGFSMIFRTENPQNTARTCRHLRLQSVLVHLWRAVPGWVPTGAAESWVRSGKPNWHLLCNQVVSVWAEGTLGRTSPGRIRQSRSIFFPRATVTMQPVHAKICRVPTLYEFSMIFRIKNP